MNMNRVILMGHLTRDPTLRSLSTGVELSEFTLAINEVIKTRDGQKDERVCFVDVVVWNAQAKACAEFLRKGSKALVEGKLQLDEWTDKTSGEKRSKLKVRADRVHFVGSPPRSADTEPAPADRPSPREVPPAPRGTRPRTMSSREEAALMT